MRILGRAPIPIRGHVPPIREERILRALQIPHARSFADVPERGVREAAARAADRCRSLSSFAAVVRTGPIERFIESGVVAFGSTALLYSKVLAERLVGAVEVTLMAVTLGPDWDAALDDLAARDEPAEAWFLDALGTHIVDRATRLVEERVGVDMARSGLTRTNRYRPGYGDWGLETQHELCTLVDAQQVGIEVNEACALLPRKSVTGVVGWRATPSELNDADE